MLTSDDDAQRRWLDRSSLVWVVVVVSAWLHGRWPSIEAALRSLVP